jgi:hypothetical protein
MPHPAIVPRHPPITHPTGPLEVDTALLDGSEATSPGTSSRYESTSPVALSAASSATRSLNFASDLLAEKPTFQRSHALPDPTLTAKDLVQPAGTAERRTQTAALNRDLKAQDAALDRRRKLHALRGGSVRDGKRGCGLVRTSSSARAAPVATQQGSSASRAALLDSIEQKQVRLQPPF